MKIITFFVSLLLFVSCASSKERTFIASTPANTLVRTFLGISLKDSVDFIRWRLTLTDRSYILHCSYGIGKPNTNGFINGGRSIEINGLVKFENDSYLLQQEDRVLKLAEINMNLLHILDEKNHLLKGNGGWSYTLNNSLPKGAGKLRFVNGQISPKDSMVFEGRTPCGIPGLLQPGNSCYKLKWLVILYGNPMDNELGQFRVFIPGWRNNGGKQGEWEITKRTDNSIIYKLNDENGNGFLYLSKLDEDVLMFTDAMGNLLVGNEDFSYTLNRKL
jgi:hypothetical protein